MVSGLHVLVLELVEGEHPDFTDEAVTEAVFHQLGECSAKWGESAVKLLRGESTYRPNQIFLEEKFHTFMCDVVTKNTIENRLWEMAALANQMECTVRAIGGQNYAMLLGTSALVSVASWRSKLPACPLP
ncbi:hypothetical protein [Alicyclobacillus fodiniaquatilis]|uniref:Uncharacterized protein n=1 Tax=Alicyclobacillus fodiniaquatilis TaxID=1661150 RepID=A0ABW4JNQ0_9BACL